MDTNSEDEQWIHETLDGNKASFGQLVQKYQNPLYDLAFRMVGSRTEAEDVLQESFIEAYRHLAGFNHQAKFSTWIYTIVLNRGRNHIRHNRVLRWLSIDQQQDSDGDQRSLDIPENAPLPETTVAQKLQLEKIAEIVRTLPAHYQAIFTLYYFHNLSMEEVADRLGRPLSTIKVYLHRARLMLYKKLPSKEVVTWRERAVSYVTGGRRRE